MLLLGLLLVVLEKTHVTDFIKTSDRSAQTDGPTKAQQEQQAKADAKAKQDYLDSVAKSDTSSGNSTSSTTESPARESGTLSVTASQSGGTVTVLTQMQGVTAGTCTLAATNGPKNTSQTAQVIYQPEFSSCAGFSVPTSTLGSGRWDISVSVAPGSGATLTKATTLEVK
ncbi:hypothetical protein KDA14_06065 [Candidatus Saccharibacteria bacterium]|nr:hypothetical protein [Candidatus Saccharibacteria bacterium]